MFFEKLKNTYNEIIKDVELKNFKIIDSNNEKDIEAAFKTYIEEIGWVQNQNFTRDRDIKNRYKFRNEFTGATNGEPDYIFYDSNENIMAICDVKNTSVGANKGLEQAKGYIKALNEDWGLDVKIALGFDGKDLILEYNNESAWERVLIDGTEINLMPDRDFLLQIIKSENRLQEVDELDEIDKERLRNFFKRCDEVFRHSNIGSSATEKFVELSTIIFLKMFTIQELDKSFIANQNPSAWDMVLAGNVNKINNEFLQWLDNEYSNLAFSTQQRVLIRLQPVQLKEIAKLIDKIFGTYGLKDFTNVKGDILEFFQNESKDRKIGEFFTPRHIIKFMVRLANPRVYLQEDDVYIEKVYDPACGTGGFLIEVFNTYKNKFSKDIKDPELLKKDVMHGTELKGNTALLAKLNMILIGDGHTNIVNANAFAYDKEEVLSRRKDIFGNYILIDPDDVEYYLDSFGQKIYHVKGDTTRKVTVEGKGKRYWLFDEFGQRIEVPEEDIVTVERKRKSNDGYFVKKINGNYYKQIPVHHFELKNELEEDKINYNFKNIRSVNPLLTTEKIDGKDNPSYQKNFGDFDIVLANQPFGLSEPTKADYHFIIHMLESLHDGLRPESHRYGRIACIVGNGFLHDDKFEEERKYLQENYFIKAIISLPQKVFAPYVEVIKSNILLIEKRKPLPNEETYFVQVKHDGYSQDNKRKREADKDELTQVLQLWTKWENDKQLDLNGDEIDTPSHKERDSIAEYHLIQPKTWAVNNYIKYKIPTFKTQLVELGDYITEVDERRHPKELVTNETDIVTVKGVSKKYGIVDSDIKSANEFNQKYKVLPKNAIAYNPSRINVGSIAINEEEDVLVSPSYVTFIPKNDNPNNRLLEKYVLYFLKSEYGKKQIEDFNFGTVRNSLKYEDLSKIKIPYISPEEQERLLILLENTHKSHRNLIDTLSSLNKVGIPDSIFEALYKDEDFETVTLGELVKESDKPTYGLSIKSDNGEEGTHILKMNNVYPVIDDVMVNDDDVDKITLDEKDIDKYLISKDDILINRTNSIDLVGKSGIYKKDTEAVFASYLMKFTIKEGYNADYISFYLNLTNVKEQIREFAVQSNGQYNINSENLKTLKIKYPKANELEKRLTKEFYEYYESIKGMSILVDTLDKEIGTIFNRHIL